MDPKPRPNHRIYLETLRRMTPAQRLDQSYLDRWAAHLGVTELLDRIRAEAKPL